MTPAPLSPTGGPRSGPTGARGTAPRVVLLFGLPRSGTTWIGKIFDSHPDTLYRHEPDSGGQLNGMPLMAPVADAETHRDLVLGFTGRLPRVRTTKAAGSLPLFPKRGESSLAFAARRLAVAGAKAVAKVLGECPVPPVGGLAVENAVIVWKSIESVGRLGAVVRLLSAPRGLLILRHPCGYVASVARGEAEGQFTDAEPASDDYGIFEALLTTRQARARGLTLDALRALHPEERLAWRWVLYNEAALDDIAGLESCRVVRYEDVCADPLAQARSLMDFTGLSWEPQTEEFVRASTSRHSSTYYSVFRDPVRAATAWRDRLSPETIGRVTGVVARSPLGTLYPSHHQGAICHG